MKSIKYLVAILGLACTLIVVAQDKVKVLIVNKLDGTKIEVPLSEIESVDVAEMDPFNGHEYVDLGLSVVWATCNVGANGPEENGNYFSWGETEPKSVYNWDSYKWCSNGTWTGMTKYTIPDNRTDGIWYSGSIFIGDNKTVLEASDDAATANWGGSWRMPTKDELDELRKNCTWTWTTKNGVNGYNVEGPNGKSIFLPAAGYRNQSSILGVDDGFYWSSTLRVDNSISIRAFSLSFTLDALFSGVWGRLNGAPIRPVCLNSDFIRASSIQVMGAKAQLTPLETLQLRATVAPNNANNKSITWSSSNTSIARVAADGLVTAVSAGSVTITATVNDGSGVKGVFTITVVAPTHEYVDLGLTSHGKPIYWATCNVGATAPEEYGDYFAWGDTEPYYTAGHAQDRPCSNWKNGKGAGYDWPSYKWCNGSEKTLTKYCTSTEYGIVDNKAVLEASDDAATANWGGAWRMPTEDELNELRDNCSWSWTTMNGVNGYNVVGPNGNSIFLPAAGYREGESLNGLGFGGGYWSSSIYEMYRHSDSFCLGFYSTGLGPTDESRCFGLPVRPVCE